MKGIFNMTLFSGRSSIKHVLSFFLLLIINALFAFKYSARATEYSLLFCLLYVAFLVAVYLLLGKLNNRLFQSDHFYYVLLVLYLLSFIISFHFIRVENLNVDRWSVISSFWDQAFKGLYPYNARSHIGNYPGPLPFYFVLALPFYLTGEIGYLSLLGIIVFAVFLRQNLSAKDSTGALFILFVSVSISWEIITRSTILVNAILFMVYLFWLSKEDINKRKTFWKTAISGGLLLSTRTIFIIPLIIYSVFQFKNKKISFKLLSGWMIIVYTVFAITFSPFLIFCFKEFLTRNPFSVQTEHLLPLSISVAFLLIAFITGFICSGEKDVIYCTTGAFVLILVTYFFYFSRQYGFLNAYLNSKIDLSYMLFVFPFVLYYAFEGWGGHHKKFLSIYS